MGFGSLNLPISTDKSACKPFATTCPSSPSDRRETGREGYHQNVSALSCGDNRAPRPVSPRAARAQRIRRTHSVAFLDRASSSALAQSTPSHMTRLPTQQQRAASHRRRQLSLRSLSWCELFRVTIGARIDGRRPEAALDNAAMHSEWRHVIRLFNEPETLPFQQQGAEILGLENQLFGA